MIELKDMCKIYTGKFGEKVALNGVNLTIKKGDFCSVMGPSGSGKSTFLHILGCMDTITTGSFKLDGMELAKLTVQEINKIRKKYISYVFQNFALMSHFTAYENVEVPLLARNVPKKERREIIKEKLEILGVEEVINKLPTEMSGGQQQRVAIARALAADTPIILADEPTGSLDQSTGLELIKVLKKLNEDGKTIIVVSHDYKIANFAKRKIKIEDGILSEQV